MDYAIVSNPSHIKLLSESVDSVEILSGETIKDKLYCNFFYN